jgi:hypothetical protein
LGRLRTLVWRREIEAQNSRLTGPLSGTHLWLDENDEGLSKRTYHAKDVLARIPEAKTRVLTGYLIQIFRPADHQMGRQLEIAVF